MTTMVEAPNDGQTARLATQFTITRPAFIKVIASVLATMGAHLREYERDDLLKFAHTANATSFGSWDQEPGCPLQQTGLCLSGKRLDSVFELFVEHYDAEMRNLWLLDDRAAEAVIIL